MVASDVFQVNTLAAVFAKFGWQRFAVFTSADSYGTPISSLIDRWVQVRLFACRFVFVVVGHAFDIRLRPCLLIFVLLARACSHVRVQSMNITLTAPTKFTLTSAVTTLNDVRAAFQTLRVNYIRLCVLAVDVSWIQMLVWIGGWAAVGGSLNGRAGVSWWVASHFSGRSF
jgi:hypothetical protein